MASMFLAKAMAATTTTTISFSSSVSTSLSWRFSHPSSTPFLLQCRISIVVPKIREIFMPGKMARLPPSVPPSSSYPRDREKWQRATDNEKKTNKPNHQRKRRLVLGRCKTKANVADGTLILSFPVLLNALSSITVGCRDRLAAGLGADLRTMMRWVASSSFRRSGSEEEAEESERSPPWEEGGRRRRREGMGLGLEKKKRELWFERER